MHGKGSGALSAMPCVQGVVLLLRCVTQLRVGNGAAFIEFVFLNPT
jgi:hypothetical protein